jgi:predicted Holliday junction resolvase-like endonuclease
MENVTILLIVFVVILIFVTILAIAIGYFWASSATKSSLSRQLKEENESAVRNAQAQLQNWKEQELTSIQKQIHDAAKGQAIQEMQEQVKKWQETELQQNKQQIYDAVRGQSTQEMQEQIKKWQETELQQIRQQIYDAVKGQSTQEMTENIQRWQQNELQSVKKQMSEALRGVAIEEAQQQLVKWRTEELEKAKSQIWEILSKEANVSLEQWKVEKEKEIRQDAIDKSQSVTMGKMTEHIVPYLPGFRFNPSDARFIGSPIDFVVFDGLGEDEVRKIVFVEVKTGASSLSTRERSIRNAVQDKKIEWLEIKVNLDNPEIVREYQSRRSNKGSE